MGYIAGWNIPGCIPEMEPSEFETEQEAEMFLQEEIFRVKDQGIEDIYVYWYYESPSPKFSNSTNNNER